MADDVFTCIFLNGNAWMLLKISLKFVPKVPINNIPALVQILAWRRSGDKPLSEPILVSLLTHICVTRPQWDNTYRFHLQISCKLIYITEYLNASPSNGCRTTCLIFTPFTCQLIKCAAQSDNGSFGDSVSEILNWLNWISMKIIMFYIQVSGNFQTFAFSEMINW